MSASEACTNLRQLIDADMGEDDLRLAILSSITFAVLETMNGSHLKPLGTHLGWEMKDAKKATIYPKVLEWLGLNDQGHPVEPVRGNGPGLQGHQAGHGQEMEKVLSSVDQKMAEFAEVMQRQQQQMMLQTQEAMMANLGSMMKSFQISQNPPRPPPAI